MRSGGTSAGRADGQGGNVPVLGKFSRLGWLMHRLASHPHVGHLPCPALAAVIGMTLLLDLLGSWAWSITLAMAGFAYGVIGIVVLGVILDAGLLTGAIVLLAATVTRGRSRHEVHPSLTPAR